MYTFCDFGMDIHALFLLSFSKLFSFSCTLYTHVKQFTTLSIFLKVYVIVELVLSSRLLTSKIRRKRLEKTAENVVESSTVRKKPTVQEYQNKTELNL